MLCTGKLSLVTKVNRTLNKDLLLILTSVKDVFEALEKINTPTLHLVVPPYYLLSQKLQPMSGECCSVALFCAKLQKFLDEKLWTLIKALH